MSLRPLVVVGASLGGFQALSVVLRRLPPDFAGAVAIVQHRRPDTGSALTRLIGSGIGRPVVEPDDRSPIAPGGIYLAPADYHLLVEPGVFALSIDDPVLFARPSIDVLFDSASRAYGDAVLGILLTGASHDGAEGLAAIARRGGRTIAQDPAEAESPIAPRAAIARGAAGQVLPLASIGDVLATFGGTKR